MQNKTINVIIPLCNIGEKDFEDRIYSLNYLINDFYCKQQGIDICVVFVEQIIDESYKKYQDCLYYGRLKYKYYTVKYGINFNKSWLYNIGVHNSEGDDIVLAEADTMKLDNSYFVNFMKFAELTKLDWSFMWEHICYLSLYDKERLILGNKPMTQFYNNHQKVGHKGIEGGFVYFKKSFYFKIGGMNEWIERFGGMDNEIVARAEYMTQTYPIYPSVIYHLYHNLSSMNAIDQYRIKNSKILQYTREHTKKIIDFLCCYKIGNMVYPLCVKEKYAEEI